MCWLPVVYSLNLTRVIETYETASLKLFNPTKTVTYDNGPKMKRDA